MAFASMPYYYCPTLSGRQPTVPCALKNLENCTSIYTWQAYSLASLIFDITHTCCTRNYSSAHQSGRGKVNTTSSNITCGRRFLQFKSQGFRHLPFFIIRDVIKWKKLLEVNSSWFTKFSSWLFVVNHCMKIQWPKTTHDSIISSGMQHSLVTLNLHQLLSFFLIFQIFWRRKSPSLHAEA